MSSASELASDPRVRRGMAAQLESRRGRIVAGEGRLGWKLGFGAPAAMRALGIAGPLIGSLTDGSLTDARAEVRLGGFTRPVLEPEVAIRLGEDVRPGAEASAARAAIAAVAPAFELADLDSPPEDVEAILAGNIFHRGVVLGNEAPDGPRALERLRALVEDGRGGVQAVEDLEALTGSIVALVRHLADVLGEFGEALAAPDIVICGSIVPPISVAPGDAVRYRLEPVGEISIRFGE